MSKIIEKIIEPSKIITGSIFKIKIKVQDDYRDKQQIKAEDNKIIITEDNKSLRTEWGE